MTHQITNASGHRLKTSTAPDHSSLRGFEFSSTNFPSSVSNPITVPTDYYVFIETIHVILMYIEKYSVLVEI